MVGARVNPPQRKLGDVLSRCSWCRGYVLYNLLHAEQRAGFVPWHLALRSRTSEVKRFIIILSLAP